MSVGSDPHAANSPRWARAQKLVENQSVKLHTFEPSGRRIWTVVGKEGDFLIDYERDSERPPYCSCDDFHFRVLSGKVPECYHLIAVKRAIEEGKYAVIEFADGEYEPFLKALLADLFSHM
jgi:predicted nucleic acid-binding Zn finger protein